MKSYNIILAGVGGQGLVLTTKILAEVALKAGYSVKTNDVIGLSQRGGKVWGSVKMDSEVFSPNIAVGQADFVIGFEPLEAYRHCYFLRKKGTIIVNTHKIPPIPVMFEQVAYPEDIYEKLDAEYELVKIEAVEEAMKLGNVKVANTFLLGALASRMMIDKSIWIEAISENVPRKTVEANLKAFDAYFEKQ
ncbi:MULTISPECIES: indolepyruvate oxidoreductase subunit beta [unclassified Fusibacter]|uniref:indolepyruvate oxidoreductase subunit beta n=1 Tax=unclassified Fusibacter TaxID=2624464 RepID=UPI001012B4E0|nr:MULTISPECIES: indolepyruvate oxidoreductase subunit beta [unclassified Fusibacter]MCK8061333.1 indolepyruvate oxidoreductase subunit beta [Fusibacter sp. A2]NPE23470.1 indolepyruvate oxidoreductase subunit beta [Fusibacter sp. A1]RXV59076.1 pyruvate ferredoxin oxidoreductase [Fusibacter sp. A1]